MKKSARNFGSVLIGIETNDPKNFAQMFRRIEEGGFTYTDITNDETLAQFVI
jgi:threonine dehydratase